MSFKLTDDIVKKYPNIPMEQLKALDGYPQETAEQILELLLADEESKETKIKKTDIEHILEKDSIEEIKEELENHFGIKIYLGEKKPNSESEYNGYISFVKNKIEIGEIWTDLYNLGNDYFVDGHLGIQIYADMEGKGYGKLLYKLYKRWSELDSSIYFPKEEYATKNSRILLLLKMGYKLESVYEHGEFRFLSEQEKQELIENANKDYYSAQGNTYKFIYLGN